MERFTNFFELHIGFPSGSSGDHDARGMLALLKKEWPDWSRSEVRAVHLTSPGCIDPHNVPGTLGCLVSRKIHRVRQSWDSTIDLEVLPNCARVLEHLSKLRAPDARLEIEFPFACLAATLEDDRLTRSAWAEDSVSIDYDKLHFQHGTMLEHVPEWEIHIQLERIPSSLSPPLAVEEVPRFLAPFGLLVEQTIEYKSEAMIEAGRSDFRLIATTYGGGPTDNRNFRSSVETRVAAERLFYQTSLCEEAIARGYTLRLILEHIVTCFRPFVPTESTVGNTLIEVVCEV